MLVDCVTCLSRRQLDVPLNSFVKDLFTSQVSSEQGVDDSAFFVICNGKRLEKDTVLEDGKTYHIVPRILGGKGGFGSMLRAIGAQIEKTTSREACRDLSGRRMRDINNEKKLKEWLAKEADREQEREERKKNRLERHLNTQHKFEDEQYHEQKAKVQEDLQDALSTGLKRKTANGDRSGPSQHKKSKEGGKKSKAEWLGVDLDSDDLSSGDSDMEADPGEPGPSISSQPTEDNEAGSSKYKPTSSPPSSSRSPEDRSLHSDSKEPGEVASNSLLTSLPSPVHTAESEAKADGSDGVTTTTTTETAAAAAASVPSDTPVDLEEFSSRCELQALGMDRLKHALMARGLKCGGTLEERANRLLCVKGLSPGEIRDSHPTLLAKPATGKGGKGKKSKG